MDIGSTKSYPLNSLSNFAPHPFILDGVECNSMEGFLQSLKFKNPEMQVHVCKLVGLTAKYKGKGKKWWKTQTLYWQGKAIDRQSQEYQDLLLRAFRALGENRGFQKALKATGLNILRHSIGKRDASKTILTEQEFCGLLMQIRSELYKKEGLYQ